MYELSDTEINAVSGGEHWAIKVAKWVASNIAWDAVSSAASNADWDGAAPDTVDYYNNMPAGMQ